MPVFLQKHQPLTPLSPSLPTALPHVCEPIPTLPLTPPDGGEYIDNAANEEAIRTALHVLSTERDALTHLGELYETDAVAQDGFVNAVNAILKTISRCGKLVVCGVGKSSKIGEKCVATMNSFGIRSTFLHPTEALHGDLGLIGPVSFDRQDLVAALSLLTIANPLLLSFRTIRFWSLPFPAAPQSCCSFCPIYLLNSSSSQ